MVPPGNGSIGRLASLVGMGRALRAARRYEDVVELVAEEARAALGAATVSLSRWDAARQRLQVIINVGALGPDEERWPEDETYPVTDYPEVSPLVRDKHSSAYRRDDPATPAAERALMARLGKSASLAAAVDYEGGLWGELYATRDEHQAPFSADDLVYAEAVADYVAVGLAHADYVAQVGRLAFEDPLTGLANRRAVDMCLDEAFSSPPGEAAVVSLLLADVNGLKHVNDLHGHEAGDTVLVEVARALAEAASTVHGSLVGRLGGDEFCVVLVGPSSDAAVRLAEEAIRLCREVPGADGVACGVASTGEEGLGAVSSPAALLRLADAAQYRAKRAGSATPVVAGRTALAVEPVPTSAADASDRRSLRGRTDPDAGRLLTDVLAALDASSARTGQDRLRVTMEAVARHLDAAAWYLSTAPQGSAVLRTVAESAYRPPGSADEGRADSMIGSEWPLAEYPQSVAALRGGSFVVETAVPGNDPAEEAVLVASGYTALLAAGGTASDGSGWLAEVFTDALGQAVTGLGPALRVLVATALGGDAAAGDSVEGAGAVPHPR